MAFESILYEVSDRVATITLNRPERLNAFDEAMLREWREAIALADGDEGVAAVVVTGAGRGFCTGMNVKAAASGEGRAAEPNLNQRRQGLRNSVHPVPRALIQFEKPYIAAVNGPAAGAGMDMATMADIRFGSTTARFSMSYVKMGLIPGDGGCYSLPRVVGVSKALELIWTGDFIDASEALRIGYLTAVYEPEELMPRVYEFAAKIANGPAVAVQLAKKLVYRSQEVTFDSHLDIAQMAMTIAQSSEDAKEGPRAFVEKREPQFKGY